MSDAWTVLTTYAADTTDAWTALNSQEGGGALIGSAINELEFSLSYPAQLVSTISIPEISVLVIPTNITSTINIQEVQQSMEPESITTTEGC